MLKIRASSEGLMLSRLLTALMMRACKVGMWVTLSSGSMFSR